MFKRILLPLDSSKLAECVLPHLVAIARICEPEVQLLRVGTVWRDRALASD